MHLYFRQILSLNNDLEDIRLPKLENILPSNLTSLNSNKIVHKCEKCNTFATDSIRSLSAHQRWCGKKGFYEINLIYSYNIL